MLREQVRQAMADLESKERQTRINLTDGDARLMKAHSSVLLGYNAQAMASPLEPDGGATGMFIPNPPPREERRPRWSQRQSWL